MAAATYDDSTGTVTISCAAFAAASVTSTGVGCYLWDSNTHTAYYGNNPVGNTIQFWSPTSATAVTGQRTTSSLPPAVLKLCVAAGYNGLRWVAESDCTPIV